ncbi:MAG: glycosyltransferase family 2 protein [Magnetococcales bacterium]|nr:glycosyltransferase family 2 protein [Magnetococcales bacterium]
MTQPPVVSILTPNFNRAAFVAETLDSLLAQDYPHWECLVVDDGSEDDSPAMVQAYAQRDGRIRFLRRDRPPKGACCCRNIGVEHSRGKYVMFLDTDDLLEPFCLAQRVAAMESRPELDFGIFPALLFRNRPHDLNLLWNIDTGEELLERQFRQDAVCQGTGPLFTRAAFDRLGRWDEGLHLWQDIDLFLRAYIQDYRCALFFDRPPDLHIRRFEGSLSRSSFFTPPKTASRIRIVRRAVALLKIHGKQHRLQEARFMLAELILGAARMGRHALVGRLIRWGICQGCLDHAEGRLLSRLALLYRWRLHRLPVVKRAMGRAQAPFICTTRMCLVPHRP